MSAPVDRLFSDPTRCRRFAPDVVMHWYPRGAVPGDRCCCGEFVMAEDAASSTTTSGDPDVDA